MEIFVWAFVGGIVGALLMDITETYAAKIGITSGVSIALVGRWFLSLLNGQFAHSNILNSKPYAHEIFGWGLFGRRGPHGTNALLASTLSHIPYGLGVGGIIALGFSV